jgi:hypothetical protein
VPEIIDPVLAKTSLNARFLLSENERFGLVLVKTGSINSGTEVNAMVMARTLQKQGSKQGLIRGCKLEQEHLFGLSLFVSHFKAK